MSSRKDLFGLGLGMSLLILGAGPARAAGDVTTVGRVKVVPIRQGATSQWGLLSDTLESRFSPASDSRFSDKRIISLRPRWNDPTQFDATIYDYGTERAYEVVLDAAGNEISRRESAEQPARSLAELADAYAVVRDDATYARPLAKGELTVYEAMPAVTVDALGRRLINVGIMSNAEAGKALALNEIVSVHIPTGQIVHYPAGAPDTSRAGLLACGPASSSCAAAVGTCAYYQVVWPEAAPVWKFIIRHPKCTQSVQADGTGLEITDAYYKGRLILKRGEVPVLNVLYDGNACGPYRDWLYSEDCFNATGTDVPAAGSGVRVASAPPSTICESKNDSGNFKGVAIYDQGDSVWIMSETNAGWYRYIMEWRFHMDGTIEPIFGFGATSNNCTCALHYHHAYWRLEWAVDATSDGTNDDPATGINTLERHRSGTPDDYDPIATEGSFIRPVSGGETDTWRVRNPLTGNGYVIQPGAKDGSAAGDAYGKWDLTALALNPNEINDPNSNTTVEVSPWLSGESLGASKRLVTWYHATYTHNDPGGTGEPCELLGPKLVPLVPCAGSINVDRNVYACGAAVGVTLSDSDLAGTGSATVAVFSGTETAAETLALAETPAGSGRFTATILTTAAPAAPGDGMVSVVDGDTVHARYIDASACGTPNVTVEKTAGVDCVTPTLSGVTWNASGTSATIGWSSSEPATSVVHYGLAIPTGSSASAAGLAATHSVLLTGLAECTTYYFWIESADEAGNTAASNHGGGYYAFTTGRNVVSSYVSSDTPIAIPDNVATGATSTIAVADNQTVQDVDVTVNITHTYDGDLALSLITPAGTSIPLATRRGGSGDNFTATVFNDEAATAISAGVAPFTDSFRPESPLSVADGASSLGSWQFKVVDQAAADVGTINAWTLALTLPPVACAAPGPPPPVPEGASGPALTASRAGGSVHLAWDASTCTAKNYHLVYGRLANLASYAPDGGVCGLGPLGSYDWEGVPAGDLWFVAVADDAASTEGSWGMSGPPADRNGATASGFCGFTARTNAGTCP